MLWALVLGGLYLMSLYSYVLFHALAEVFRLLSPWRFSCRLEMCAGAGTLFAVRGRCVLFIGGLDLVIPLPIQNGVFRDMRKTSPTHCGSGSYLQSVSLLVARFFLATAESEVRICGYVAAQLPSPGAIFIGMCFRLFCCCRGLTPFKKLSEYVIGVILLVSIALLLRKRDLFDPTALRWMVSSITLTILSEMCFQSTVDAYGLASLLGIS